MAKIFDTSLLDETTMKSLSEDEVSWIYNGLDCCVTAEVYGVLKTQLYEDLPNVREVYETALAKQAPIMEMSMRGMRVDSFGAANAITSLRRDLEAVEQKFNRICSEVFDCPVKWSSHVQVKNLFYGILGIKEIRKRNSKGVFAPTVNEDALEKIAARYFLARPLARMILVMRDLAKQISFLETERDDDGRLRTSYNIAGTNTGRLTSSMSDFGSGTNLQNVNRKLRQPFIADDGMIMLNIDLEQADGRNIGAVCWNMFYESHGPEFAGSFLNAAESGDLHTTVCRMTWRELDWPEDESQWKSFCDGIILHGQDSYRQIAKKLGHGTNYFGQPRTMAGHTHAPVKLIEDFQNRYFNQFPCIPAMHRETIRLVRETGVITSLFGRRRMFFGRGNDAATHRKAIAYQGQSPTGDQIDRGLLRVWRRFPQVQLLNQVHDSVGMQVPYSEHADLIPEILSTMQVNLTLAGGREFFVPLEAKIGWNWGDYDERKNPHGLKKWKGKEDRERPSPRSRLKDYL